MNFKFKKIIKNEISIYLLEYNDFEISNFYYVLNTKEQAKVNSFKSDHRKKEFIATRILKNKFLKDIQIEYNNLNAPVIKNGFISISHTNGIVGIAFSTIHKVGLDIEQIRENINKIKTKFISEDEISHFDMGSNFDLTKIWSFKEVLYKISNKNGLDLKKELKVSKINNETYQGYIMYDNKIKKSKLSYQKYKNFIIAFNITDCE